MLMNRHSFAAPVRPVFRALLATLAVASVLLAGAAQAQAPADPYDYERASSFTYKTNGLLESETVEPDKPALCVTTTYSYDDYGNKTGARTAPCAASSGSARFTARESRTVYEAAEGRDLLANGGSSKVNIPRGQFATTVTNALEHKEQREVDPRFGTVLKLTGPNSLATKVVLDDFGRATQEQRADGTSTHTHYCILAGRGMEAGSSSPGCAQHSLATNEAPTLAVQYVHSEPRDKAGSKMGPFARVYTDRLGRKIREVGESFDGRLVVHDTQYNAYGAAILTTQPYFLASGSSTAGGSADAGMTLTTYDALGRAVRVDVADPAGHGGTVDFAGRGSRTAASTRLQPAGLMSTTTDDLGHTRKEEKNAEGKLVRVTDDTGAQVAYQHDAFGNLVQTQDALKNLLKVTYDTRGRKLSVDDPDTGLWTYCYNALGELRAQQSPNQRGSTATNPLPAQACPAIDDSTTAAVATPGWTTLAYDLLGRLVDRQEPEFRSTWSYDRYADNTACAKGTGKLCESSTTGGVKRQHQYDSLGRPEASRTTITNGPSFASALNYDENTGRLSGRSYPTGLALSYAYNERGYLSQVKLATAATVTPRPATASGTPAAGATWAAGKVLWQAGSYNAWGTAGTETLGNDVVTRASFDAATGRVTDASAGKGTATNVLKHVYVWDSAGNLSSRADGNGDGNTGAVSESFQYDSLNRLTQYSVDAPQVPNLRRTVDLAYNAIGNLLRKSDVGNYEYPAFGSDGNVTRPRPHAVTRVSGSLQRSYTYDANGNVTNAIGSKYAQISYTSFNLPGSQAGISGSGTAYTWGYDENHQRVQETRSNASGTRTTWYQHPDNAGGLSFESEKAPSGAIDNRHYVSAGSQTLVLVSTGALPTLAATDRKPPAISSIALVKVEYWHKDHLGSLAATTDHTGNVTARYAYDPFGKRRETNGRYDENGNPVIDWTGDTDHGTDRGFTGHEHLDDIGLIHMNGRLFDPLIGRFLQGDPMIQAPEELQNYNRYSYCLNNPLNCTDPTGYWSLKKFMKAVARATFRPTLKRGIEVFAAQPGQDVVDRLVMRNQFVYQVGMIVVSYYGGPWAAAAYSTYYTERRTGSMNAAFKAGAITLASAALSWGAGEVGRLTEVGGFAHFAAHMASGCIQAEMGGGKCGQGALSSAFTLAATPTIAKYTGNNAILGAMGAAVVGGTASVIGGGKFSSGAQTGAFSYLFNHWAHALELAVYGVDAHQALQGKMFSSGLATEQQCAGGMCVDGRFDIADGSTFELWEIKRGSPAGIAAGVLAISAYTDGTGFHPGGDLPGLPVGGTMTVRGFKGEYLYTNMGGGLVIYKQVDTVAQFVSDLSAAAKRAADAMLSFPSLLPGTRAPSAVRD
jgi:RHS repeat-associated protein